MFTKIVFTILAILAVWFGFRYYNRFIVGPTRRREMQRPAPPPQASPTGPVEDMTQCAVCGAYVPAQGTRRCGRPDCPF